MPESLTVTSSYAVGGRSYVGSRTVSGNVAINFTFDPAAAKAGTLTTRTDNDTGTITMSSGGHGITTGAKVDVYWDGGSRYDVTVGTVSGTSVPIDLGAGDNLPIATTAVTVQVREEQDFPFAGDDMAALSISAGGANATVLFLDGSDAVLLAIELDSTTTIYTWDSGNGATNPLAGDTVAKVTVTQGGSTSTARVQGTVLIS